MTSPLKYQSCWDNPAWIAEHLDIAARAEVQADACEDTGSFALMRKSARIGAQALIYIAHHAVKHLSRPEREALARRASRLYQRGRSRKASTATAFADKIRSAHLADKLEEAIDHQRTIINPTLKNSEADK